MAAIIGGKFYTRPCHTTGLLTTRYAFRVAFRVAICFYLPVCDFIFRQTITRGDQVVVDLHERRGPLANVRYRLFDAAGNAHEVTGPYWICDNGYHKWQCLINPLKASGSRDEYVFSGWLESMRKDVEVRCVNMFDSSLLLLF